MHELLFPSILALIAAWMAGKLVEIYWWKPKRIQKIFMDQGIAGPPYIPFIGSLGELVKIYAKAGAAQSSSTATESETTPLLTNSVQLAFPHLPIWRAKYGSVFLYWYGRIPRLSISDPELVKELGSTPRKYYQSIQHPLIYNLIGKSILGSGGELWSTKRRLLNPLFLLESLKSLSSLIVDAMDEKITIWRSLMKSDAHLELDMCSEFEDLSQKIITRVMFGNDAEEGMQIAKLHSEQAAISSKAVRIFYIPGTKFIPTLLNRRSKWLRRKAETIFHELIERRLKNANTKENDWVSLMLSSGKMTRHQIVDECCSMLIAGSESTNLLLAWVCLNLGVDKMWQHNARDEINQVLLKENRPIIEVLSHLKILNMIINESLRLHPSVPYVMKYSKEDVQLGDLKIPAGIDIEVPIMSVHYDASVWGDNAGQFDPSRFSDGVSKASKHPMAFMPFMLGPRICPGMNFAMIEAKVALAMILQNFEITISPKYKHLPVGGISLRQGFGAPVIIRKI